MANKFGIDTDALVEQFAQASAKQADTARKAAHAAVLKSLQGRELTMKAVKDAVGVVTKAASAGAAQNSSAEQAEAMLANAVAGMDDAVRQAVQASQRAIQQLVEQGADLREKQLKKAVSEIEKMEDAFFDTIRKAAQSAAAQPLANSWARTLSTFQKDGTATGGAADAAIEQLTQAANQAQQAARKGREFSQQATQLMLDHFAAMATGVLLGMSEAMGGGPETGAGTGTQKKRR